VICEGWTRRVTREEKDGSFTVLANTFQGRRLNKPNDVVVKSDGAIYFTDPWNIAPPAGRMGPAVQWRLPARARPRQR
jgi:gluconolactonase